MLDEVLNKIGLSLIWITMNTVGIRLLGYCSGDNLTKSVIFQVLGVVVMYFSFKVFDKLFGLWGN